MSDDTITFDEITVTVNWEDDDGDDTTGPQPRPARSFTQVILRDPSDTIAKYSGAGGPVKPIVDVAEKGTCYLSCAVSEESGALLKAPATRSYAHSWTWMQVRWMGQCMSCSGRKFTVLIKRSWLIMAVYLFQNLAI